MDIFPKCSVCHQQFTLKGPVPYLLPCLHAVCEKCVTSAAGGVISCRTCQTEVNLTDTSLQKDAVRQKEIFHLTVKHRPTELLCTHEDDGNQAVCWCRECEEFLCEFCQNMHNTFKLTRNHLLQNFNDIKPVVSNIPTPCSIHNHDSLYLFDRKCNILICARCRIENHADHEVEKLEVFAESVTKQLVQHKQDLSTLQNRQQSHIQNIRQGTEFTDRTHDTVKETISHTFRSLQSQLDQREKELLTDLESQTEKTKTALHTRLTTSEDALKTCTDVLDYINKVLLFASQEDLTELGSSVGETTRAFLDTTVPQTHGIPVAVFNTNGLSKLKSNISEFGSTLTREIEEENTRDQECQTKHDCSMAEYEVQHKTRIDDEENVGKRGSKAIDFLLGLVSECGVHLLTPGAVDRSMVLKCIRLQYDSDRANLDYVGIYTGELVNRKSDTRFAGEGRLKNYRGTCSKAPLPQLGCPQYWEMEARVDLENPLTENALILEVGVCAEGEMDMSHCVQDSPRAYCMGVYRCPAHGGICRITWKEGEEERDVLHLPDTLTNTAGASATLHYGVVYDDVREKIVFIDVKENKLVSMLDNVDSSQLLWPMFGVYNQNFVTVSMRLVVGSDIYMTEEKKAMIVVALS